MRINVGTTNFKVKRRRFGGKLLVFLLFIGAILTGAGYFALSASQVDPAWTKVSGEIVNSSIHNSDGSTTYSPVVEYTVNRQKYTVTGSISTSSYPAIGSQRQVAYNPAQPAQAKLIETAKTMWFLYIFPIVGIALLVIAPVAFLRSLKRSDKIKSLMQSGQKLQGVIVELQNSNGGRGDYKIVVAATDPSGIVRHFTSDPLSGIAGLAMADFQNNPIAVDVYVDIANPDIYYVGIADIPNLTPERIGELIKKASSQHKP